jgi:uncharacterized protein YndB with AHSA1/START domain
MKGTTAIVHVLSAMVLFAGIDSLTAQTRTVETTVRVEASPEQVVRAFIDPGDLRGWWKVTRSFVEATPGGVWSVSWDDYGEEGTQHSWVGVVDEIGPRRLSISHLVMLEPDRPIFAPLGLEIVAAPDGRGTRLTVYHKGYQAGEQWDWMHDTVVAGWQHVLGSMQEWFEQTGTR